MWKYYWGMRHESHDMDFFWIILFHTMYWFDLLLIRWNPVIINAQLGPYLDYLLFAHLCILFRNCRPGLARSQWSTSYNEAAEGLIHWTTSKGFSTITAIRSIQSRNYIMPEVGRMWEIRVFSYCNMSSRSIKEERNYKLNYVSLVEELLVEHLRQCQPPLECSQFHNVYYSNRVGYCNVSWSMSFCCYFIHSRHLQAVLADIVSAIHHKDLHDTIVTYFRLFWFTVLQSVATVCIPIGND